MKALKEKRVSLRSLFRRSLVILSILALAFAMGACGDDSSDDPGTDPGPGDPNQPPVTPTAPYAESISILTEPSPSNPQFEGMPPDLTGMVLSVKWSNNSIAVPVTDLSEFYTIPTNIDLGIGGDTSKGNVNREFRIAHKGSTVSSGPFYLTNKPIIPLSNLNLTSKGVVDWFSDKGADFSNLVLQGTWRWNQAEWAALTGTQWNYTEKTWPELDTLTSIDKSVTKDIPMSPTFPMFDISEAESNNRIKTNVGKREAHLTLSNFYVIQSVEFASADTSKFFLYDDQFIRDIDKSGTFDAADADDPNFVNRAYLLNLLAESNAQFKLLYRGVTGGTAERTISWREFLANWATFVQLSTQNPATQVKDSDLLVGWDATQPGNLSGTSTLNPDRGLLVTNDDGDYPIWRMILQYVPVTYAGVLGDAYITMFPVPVRVYAFEGLADPAIARKPGTGSNNVWVDYYEGLEYEYPSSSGNNLGQLPIKDIAGFKQSIKDQYTLTANFASGTDNKPRVVDWDVVAFGVEAEVASGVDEYLIDCFGSDDPLNRLAKGGIRPDTYYLDLTYRGETLGGEESIPYDIINYLGDVKEQIETILKALELIDENIRDKVSVSKDTITVTKDVTFTDAAISKDVTVVVPNGKTLTLVDSGASTLSTLDGTLKVPSGGNVVVEGTLEIATEAKLDVAGTIDVPSGGSITFMVPDPNDTNNIIGSTTGGTLLVRTGGTLIFDVGTVADPEPHTAVSPTVGITGVPVTITKNGGLVITAGSGATINGDVGYDLGSGNVNAFEVPPGITLKLSGGITISTPIMVFGTLDVTEVSSVASTPGDIYLVKEPGPGTLKQSALATTKEFVADDGMYKILAWDTDQFKLKP